VNNEILKMLAQRCCVLVSQTSFPTTSPHPVTLSVSIGGSVVLPDDSIAGLIARADELMYEGKTGGRGRASTR